MKFATVVIFLAANVAAQIVGGSTFGNVVNDVIGDNGPKNSSVRVATPSVPPAPKTKAPPAAIQTLITSTVAPPPAQTTPAPESATSDSSPVVLLSSSDSASDFTSSSTPSATSSASPTSFTPIFSSVPDSSSAAATKNDDSASDSSGGLTTTNKVIIGVSIGVGVPILALVIHVLYYAIKNRRSARRRLDDDDFPSSFEKLTGSVSDLSLHHQPNYGMVRSPGRG